MLTMLCLLKLMKHTVVWILLLYWILLLFWRQLTLLSKLQHYQFCGKFVNKFCVVLKFIFGHAYTAKIEIKT